MSGMVRLATPAEARPSTESLIEEERRLHERVVQRDESALLECLDRIGDLVYCTALLRTGRQASAEDLTERLFVAYWRNPEAFHPSRGPLGLQFLRRMTEALGSVSSS